MEDVCGNSRHKYEEDNLDESSSKKSMLGKSSGTVTADNSVVLNVKHPRSNKQCTTSAMLQRLYLESRIPKDLVTPDEKYLWNCLELIHNSAFSFSKADAFRISVELSAPTTIMGCSSSENLTTLVLDNCLATDTGGQWIMGSKSMINIMKRQLSQCPDREDINLRILSITGSRKEFSSEIAGGSKNQRVGMFSSSQDHGNKDPTSMEGHVTDTGHRGFASLESRNSSAKSAAPFGGSASQGMLHLTWKGGIPHFVFSMDDHKEVYLTNLTNAGACSEGSPLYIYFFYSKVGDHTTAPPHLVGEMKVTTSYSICSHNSKITETQFGLSVTGGETQGASDNLRRYKRLPKKVADLFRNSKFFKRRSMISFDRNLETPFPKTSQQEARASIDKLKQRSMSSFDWNVDTPFPETSLEGRPNLDGLGGESPLLNHELAAIVVKGHCSQVKSAGGWGLKFLRKAEARKGCNSLGVASLSECFSQSPLMDIIIPAGIHGKPRTMDDGEPSPLIDRWRSGGQCSCGGWDLGCPLTILKAKSTPQDSSDKAEDDMEFFIQGSKQSIPTFRMKKLREGLYLVHFQPRLSALQSFSIAVAHIHTQSHSLGRTMHRNLNDTEVSCV